MMHFTGWHSARDSAPVPALEGQADEYEPRACVVPVVTSLAQSKTKISRPSLRASLVPTWALGPLCCWQAARQSCGVSNSRLCPTCHRSPRGYLAPPYYEELFQLTMGPALVTAGHNLSLPRGALGVVRVLLPMGQCVILIKLLF